MLQGISNVKGDIPEGSVAKPLWYCISVDENHKNMIYTSALILIYNKGVIGLTEATLGL